ncbi:hypothetical protein [Celeribacter persicus]|uniref:Uncharacterized protein n=1 Tax=Celeribacter persicus TaxID=1651082 RepID=A0A2T5HGL3_9RHOB|nr:hypothetical protein [Celeribacter persicus]PTQ70713.1 hypothetical protein C8N42_10942 [Celeribacter persicus]
MDALASAFEEVGVEHFSSNEPDHWCAEGALMLLADVSAAFKGDQSSDGYIAASGVFALVFCDHFIRLATANKENAAIFALKALGFGNEEIRERVPIMDFYETLQDSSPNLLNEIGQGCAQWVLAPNSESLRPLRSLFIALADGLE